jgi:hypothetical protein
MREQFNMAFRLLPGIIQGKVSLDRMDSFLDKVRIPFSRSETSVEPRDQTVSNNGSSSTIATDNSSIDQQCGFENCCLVWDHQNIGPSSTLGQIGFRLRIVDRFTLTKKGLNVVQGPTGSGKTSLLHALLGEMRVVANGPRPWFKSLAGQRAAYCTQGGWVFNGTIKALELIFHYE